MFFAYLEEYKKAKELMNCLNIGQLEDIHSEGLETIPFLVIGTNEAARDNLELYLATTQVWNESYVQEPEVLALLQARAKAVWLNHKVIMKRHTQLQKDYQEYSRKTNQAYEELTDADRELLASNSLMRVVDSYIEMNIFDNLEQFLNQVHLVYRDIESKTALAFLKNWAALHWLGREIERLR